MSKQELIENICATYYGAQYNGKANLSTLGTILEKNIPDFNPYKIDKERLLAIWIKNTGVLLEEAIKEYNSTLPEGLKPLPSVEELEKELRDVFRKYGPAFTNQAQHIHSKYSLKPCEWWRDLKEGDKFIWEKEVQKFKTFRTYLEDEDGITYLSKICTPYTITADEIIKKHNLTEEEVRLIREGKG